MNRGSFYIPLIIVTSLVAIAVLAIFLLNVYGTPAPVEIKPGSEYNTGIPPGSGQEVTIALAGDCSGYNVAVPDVQGTDPLNEVRPLIDRSDIFLFNMECVFLQPGQLDRPSGTKTSPRLSLLPGLQGI